MSQIDSEPDLGFDPRLRAALREAWEQDGEAAQR